MLQQALSLSLATTHKISFDFFSFGYLDVSVPQVRFAFAIPTLHRWVFPFGYLRLRLLTAYRSFSQSITSFIASYRQGIHRMRLFS